VVEVLGIESTFEAVIQGAVLAFRERLPHTYVIRILGLEWHTRMCILYYLKVALHFVYLKVSEQSIITCVHSRLECKG
jgi:hypothetical protein